MFHLALRFNDKLRLCGINEYLPVVEKDVHNEQDNG